MRIELESQDYAPALAMAFSITLFTTIEPTNIYSGIFRMLLYFLYYLVCAELWRWLFILKILEVPKIGKQA
jgi:hypothetical protein